MTRVAPLALACALALAPVLAGCASSPDVRALCGVWANDDSREQWWLDGPDLRGEGRVLVDGVEQTRETLVLRAARGGHVYVASPAGAAATEFRPIQPDEARFGAASPAAAMRWSWANYAHDFPQEIHYALVDDQLRAVVSGPDGATGWTFHRVAACPSN